MCRPAKEDSDTEDEEVHPHGFSDHDDDDRIAEAMQGLTTLQHGSPRLGRRPLSPAQPRRRGRRSVTPPLAAAEVRN
jgi:hypothetical protein